MFCAAAAKNNCSHTNFNLHRRKRRHRRRPNGPNFDSRKHFCIFRCQPRNERNCLRTTSALVFSVLCVPPISGWTPSTPAEPCSKDKDKNVVLIVLLQDVFNPHREIRIPVRPNKGFRVSDTSGTVQNTISGQLQHCTDGKYPQRLTISEWASEKSNITGSSNYLLELGKPQGGGPIFSFVYLRTITL